MTGPAASGVSAWLGRLRRATGRAVCRAPSALVADLCRFWRGRLAGAGVLAGLLVLAVVDAPVLQDLRFWAFDRLQNAAPRQPSALPVVIVDIDEASLDMAGQWPWPRTVMAEMLRRIAAMGPLAIGFDMIFAEVDRTSPDQMARTVPNLPAALKAALMALPSNDARFAKVLGATPSVLGVGILPETAAGQAAADMTRVAPYRAIGGDPLALLPDDGVPLLSIDSLVRAAPGQGVLASRPERDGTVRRLPAIFKISEKLYPGFSVELLRVLTGAQSYRVFIKDDRFAGVKVGPLAIPTDSAGRVWLHFSGHDPRRFVSASKILRGTADPALIARKLVLIGSSGLGLVDFPATPIDPRVPGAEIHAQLLESVLENSLLLRPAWAVPAEMATAAVLGLVMIMLMPLWRPSTTAVLPLVMVGLTIGGVWVAFTGARLLLDPSLPTVASLLVFGVMLALRLIAVDRARRVLWRDLAEQRAAAQRLEGELTAARNIQMGLVPRDFPAFPHRAELQIFARMEPARQVGGDLYDFFELDDGRILFLVGDVAGKGVPAALFMALTKAFCRGCAIRANPDHGGAGLGAILTEANALIAAENKEMLFVTLFAGLLNPATGQLDYVNAGHESPFLVRTDGTVERLAGDTGPPLCVIDDFDYQGNETVLAPHELMVVISDGVSEAQNPSQALFGVGRVESWFEAGRTPPPEDTVVGLFEAVKQFAAGAEPSDDITVLAVRCLPDGAPDGTMARPA